MIPFFNNNSPTLLGIDISSTRVKLLELQKANKRYSIESYAIIPMPAGIVVENIIKDKKSLSETVRKAIAIAKTTAKHAAITIADSLVITKIVQMDQALSEQDIEHQIAIDADKYFPYPLEEISLDFAILGPTANNSTFNNILLVASRSENVNSWTRAVSDAGLTVKVVDISSYATERSSRLILNSLPNKNHDETIAIIDIGACVTNFTVLYNMTTIFTREDVFGGEQLTKTIQHHYGLSYREAELAKIEGNLPDNYTKDILNPYKKSAFLQIKRALQFFYATSQHNKVKHLILAGGTANMPGLAKEIEEQIGIPCSIANPFTNMMVSEHIDRIALKRDASSLMVSCGLALRSFDRQG